MSTAYRKRPYAGNREHKPNEPLGLLGSLDRIEHAPGKAKSTQRYTQYESVRLLLVHPLIRQMLAHVCHWADPCAGDGRMVDHVQRAHADGLVERPPYLWNIGDIEQRDDLAARAYNGVGPKPEVRVGNGADLFTDVEPNRHVECVLTNWPWYGWTRHLEKARELYPDAVIAGISCDQERRDGGRADWYKAHRPSVVAALPGRQTFPAPGERGAATYPYTTSWYIWAAGVSDAPRTEMIWL